MADFNNQIALVTGASGGIGGAIATELAQKGTTILLVGRNEAKLTALATNLGSKAISCPVDLTQDQDIDGLIAQVKTRFGRLDILVHSAGVIAHEKLTTAPVEMLDQHYITNIRGPYKLTQGLIPLLKKPRGQIVFINSSVGLNASSEAGQYSMIQHAFKAMADALRGNVNADSIKIMSVYPGRTATQIIEALSAKEGTQYKPELLLQPEDVANIVVQSLSLPWTAEVTNIQIRPMIKSY